MLVPQGIWVPPRIATLYVAASDALDRSRAQCDFLCSGASDQVEINEALSALPAGVQGRVILSEGTFTIDAPITIPNNNITLEGQGSATFIDGDGLATGEHGIVISGKTGCVIKSLAIQTQDGAGKTCHCIFAEDGCNDLLLWQIEIVNSDSDGIHIEGTSIQDVRIRQCKVNGADGNGIYLKPDANIKFYRIHVANCLLLSAGGVGILFDIPGGTGEYLYCEVNNNIIYNPTGAGIQVETYNQGDLSNNFVISAGANGFQVGDSSNTTLEGNNAIENTSDGISLMVTNDHCSLIGNLCYKNGGHGINNVAATNTHILIEGNDCSENGYDGIHSAGPDAKISGNYCYINSQNTVGTYHGISLAAGAVRTSINDNVCSGDGASQEDGIAVTDGLDEIQINNNYCYNGMGSGISLAGTDDDCQIKSNYCSYNDDYGIEIGAGCERTLIEGNKLKGNVTGNLLDSGVLTTVEESNKDITPPEVKRYVYMKNTSAAQRVAGDVVVFKAGVAAGDEFTTTTTLGDDHVLGIVAETIAVDAYGYVQVAGKTTVLKGSNDKGDIAIGDFLCASDTAVEAVKAGALDTAFAIALEALAAPGPEPLDALLINPMTF